MYFDLEKFEDLNTILDEFSKKSNLIKPVFLIMLYVRAKREGDWPMHLYAVRKMIPYFFAAGHHNYARYGLYYLRTMERLPTEIYERFMSGEHVTRHHRGYWNGIWSDMFIETTFMRYGKGPGGIVGVTLQPNVVKKWAYSLHICTQLLMNLDEMRRYSSNKEQEIHKEEMPSRKKSDELDRQLIRKKLQCCVHPLKCEVEALLNIYSGLIAKDDVNVFDSVKIGEDQLSCFESSWPGGFYTTISKRVKTMKHLKRAAKCDEVEIFNTEMIYSRVMCLLSMGRIELEEVLKYELSPIPMALFDGNGLMRDSKGKSALKNALQVEICTRQPKSDVVIIDGCALFWHISWPLNGLVKDLATSFYDFIAKYFRDDINVHLIFDRYFKYSIKGQTRKQRIGNVANKCIFSLQTPLQTREATLSSSDNKVQIVDLISTFLIEKFKLTCFSNRFVVTFSEFTPVQVQLGVVIPRSDLYSTHEEADVNIVRQCFSCIDEGAKRVKVLCDDTDVFILLMVFSYRLKVESDILMESFNSNRSVINIIQSKNKHSSIMPSLIAAHALSGCDSVPRLFGIGKLTVLKHLKQGILLTSLGDKESNIIDVYNDSGKFISACYGVKDEFNLSKVRYLVWRRKAEGKISATPKLAALPPTTEVFNLNVLRAHYQACIWNSCLENNPPDLNPCDFGWKKDTLNDCLELVFFPDHVLPIPTLILKRFSCKCLSEKTCSRCSCTTAGLSCSKFCSCYGKECLNPRTKDEDENTFEESEDEENDDD